MGSRQVLAMSSVARARGCLATLVRAIGQAYAVLVDEFGRPEPETLGSATKGANCSHTLRHSFGEVAAAKGWSGRGFLCVSLNQRPLANSVTAPLSVARKAYSIGGRDDSDGTQPMQMRSPTPKTPCRTTRPYLSAFCVVSNNFMRLASKTSFAHLGEDLT